VGFAVGFLVGKIGRGVAATGRRVGDSGLGVGTGNGPLGGTGGLEGLETGAVGGGPLGGSSSDSEGALVSPGNPVGGDGATGSLGDPGPFVKPEAGFECTGAVVG
jgi:hypothetical protein